MYLLTTKRCDDELMYPLAVAQNAPTSVVVGSSACVWYPKSALYTGATVLPYKEIALPVT